MRPSGPLPSSQAPSLAPHYRPNRWPRHSATPTCVPWCLQTVWCEARRPGEQRLPPGLVLALIDVESRFNRWAVSSAGAVGLMQVMPFWPAQLGMHRHQLTQVDANLRMGCAILRHYLAKERNDLRRALGRYNGSLKSRQYPDLVVLRWSRNWNGADDLGAASVASR